MPTCTRRNPITGIYTLKSLYRFLLLEIPIPNFTLVSPYTDFYMFKSLCRYLHEEIPILIFTYKNPNTDFTRRIPLHQIFTPLTIPRLTFPTFPPAS